jgi:predicted CopG family antitoxin
MHPAGERGLGLPPGRAGGPGPGAVSDHDTPRGDTTNLRGRTSLSSHTPGAKCLYTVVYNMGTRMVRLDDDVYERIEAHKREDETFSEAIDRLIEVPPLGTLAGILSDEEAEEFREMVEDVDSTATTDVDDLVPAVERTDK